MSIDIFAQRLRARIREDIAANHAEMDKGKPHDEYMKLVGRNAALAKMLDHMKDVSKELAKEIAGVDYEGDDDEEN